MGKNVKRLYRETTPEHYELILYLDTKNMKFFGQVKIKFKKAGRPSKRVTFHQKDLKIKSASLIAIKKGVREEIKLTRINTHKSLDEVRLHAGQLLFPGEYEARLEFAGKITSPMHGLYPGYFSREGKKKLILATQFESHHAREVFPCIDEPEAKATFELSLKTEAGLTVLSNTPVKKEAKSGKNIKTVFEKTPIMSTYLLAFVVGELHCVEAKTKDGITMRTWASLVQPKKFLDYANKEAVAALEFFSDYFQTPYPLVKCDQVALPDFDSGAMENWGLITYREVALLADPVNRSLSSEQYVSMVIAHELSHQWFGNLVTMKWWNDLWLNESFASFMEHIALDALHPDWHQWEHYTITDILVTSNRDIYKDVQPVGVNVRHPDEITTLFDPAIVYAKGGRLLKMMREVIGEQAFRNGLKQYFKDNAYKNAERGDLWKALSAAGKSDVAGLMTPWIEQPGMPLLSVEKSKDNIKLSQQRFLLDGEDKEKVWPIALLPNKKLPAEILDKKTLELNASTAVLFNTNGSGHYLVDYKDKATKQNLARAIAAQDIPTEGRIIRLNDMLLLARAGNGSLVEALDVVKGCGREPREAVWGMISRVVSTAKILVEGDEKAEEGIKKLRRELGNYHYRRLGWQQKDDEPANDRLLRQTILGIMLGGEDKKVISESIKLYEQAKDIDDLPAELRTIILTAAVRFGPKKSLDELLKTYRQTANPDLKQAISSAVTDVRDAKLGQEIINKAIADGGFVRPQDIFRWFAYFIRNQYCREAAWEWLVSDWKRLEKLFGGSKMMDYMPVYAAAPLSTPEWENKYRKFFTPLLTNIQLERNIKIGFAEIAARVAWRKREEPKLKKYFLAQTKESIESKLSSPS